MQLVTLIWALNNSPNHHPYANIGANTTKVTFQKIQLDNLEKMTLIHLVLLKFKSDVTQEHKDTFLREVRALKNLPSVKDGRLLVGGPSLTDPIRWSKGFELALVSYHENLAALREYQASKEHHRVTSTYMFPFDEDLCSFDFEVDPADEYMCAFGPLSFLAGKSSGKDIPVIGKDKQIDNP